MTLHLHAKPNARRNQLLPGPAGWCAWPPQAGQANAVLVAFLAEVLGVAKRHVTLLSGHNAPSKNVEINGLSEETEAAILVQYHA